ncbi:hypothetical protein [Paenibacillus sp. FSL W8-0194]|uniref:hypothetical protein n=1 Tax=Paenibacillus sp. FSL W8-0194 TaxID=2921711 RepID=UPI0030D975BE
MVGFQEQKNGSKLSASSAYKYARVIKNISDDIIEIGLFEKSFYVNISIQELVRDIQHIKKRIMISLLKKTMLAIRCIVSLLITMYFF